MVVVADEESTDRYVLIDGYLRVAVLEQLCRDEVDAQLWQMPEVATEPQPAPVCPATRLLPLEAQDAS